MGLYGYSRYNATNIPTQWRPALPSQPQGGGSTSRLPGSRMFPERVDVSDPGVKLIGEAARFPGYIYDRIPAAADVVSGGLVEKGIEAAKSVPLVGPIISGIGKAFEISGSLFPSVWNSPIASTLQNNSRMPDSAPLGDVDKLFFDPGKWLSGSRVTWGDYRNAARRRGFTDREMSDLAQGKRGIFDFGDAAHPISEEPLLNLAGRVATDPINIAFMGSGAIVGGARAAARAMRLVDASAEVSRAVNMTRPALAAIDGVAALEAGQTANVTGRSLGLWAMKLGRGSYDLTLGPMARGVLQVGAGERRLGLSNIMRGYRNASIGAYGAQVAVTSVGDIVEGNSPAPGPFRDLFMLGRAIRDNKPLSEGMLFTMVSAFNFPARSMIASVASKGKVAYYSKAALTLQPELVKGLKGGTLDETIAKFGGQESWLDFLGHLVSRIVAKDIAPAIRGFGGNSFMAIALRSMMMHGLVRSAAIKRWKVSPITGQQALIEAQDWAAGLRGIKEMSGGIAGSFDVDALAQTWLQWRPMAAELSKVMGDLNPLVIGLNNRLLTKEHIAVARQRFKDVAENGNVSPKDAQEIIRDFPKLIDSFPTGTKDTNLFQQLLVPDGQSVPLRWLEQRLKALEQEAFSTRAVLANLDQYEAKADREAFLRSTMYRADGKVNRSALPTESDIQVNAVTARNAAKSATGHPMETQAEVAEARSNPSVIAAEKNIPNALSDAGYGVDYTTQVTIMENGTVAPALSINLDPATDIGTAAEIVAVALSETGSNGIAQIIVRGDQLLREKRLRPNGVEYRWEAVGNAAQNEAVARLIAQLYGHSSINTVHGVFRVLVRKSDRIADGTLDRMNSAMAEIFPNHATNGVFKPRAPEPVWEQTIRNDVQKGLRRGKSAGPLGADLGLIEVTRRARSSIRYHVARSELTRLRESDLAGADGLAARPGPGADVYEGTGGPRPDEPVSGQPADVRGEVAQVPTAAPVGAARKTVDPVQAAEARVLPEPGITFLINRDAEVAAFRANFDPGVEAFLSQAEKEALSADRVMKLSALQAEIRLLNPAYTIKVVRKGGTPYYVGQGNALMDVAMGRMASGDGLKYAMTSNVAAFVNKVVAPVYSVRLAEDAKQAFYNEGLAGYGATTSEINRFMAALRKAAVNSRLVGRVRLFRRGDMLPPDVIEGIARGTADSKIFGGFSRQVLDAVPPGGFTKMIDRAGSRLFRKLSKEYRINPDGGGGVLGKLLDYFYETPGTKLGAAGRRINPVHHYIKGYYQVLRFLMSPRWHLMNRYEADILSLAGFGQLAHPHWQEGMSKAATIMSEGKMIDESMAGAGASGIWEARKYEGVVSNNFKVGRLSSTRTALRALARDDPSAVFLREKFGGSVDDWVNGLEQMMYDWDTKGIGPTLVDSARAEFIQRQDYEAMGPLIQQLHGAHQQIWKDVNRMIHGNPDRSNLERVLNSYFLFWPISYQLKASKWMFDVLTKRALGKNTNLGGAWTINRLFEQHKDRMLNDPSYRDLFIQHPQLWQVVAMMLPITPWDMGATLSRPTRYIGSALGAALGLWPKDEAYPDPTNLMSFAYRVMALGPVYDLQLLTTLDREFNRSPEAQAKTRREYELSQHELSP